nr:immunoglobulin light chain junction region [Macaca mulatta]MOV61874.1 immunoglobulin light chain junction region [Macaca mulatta]MOV62096.1 immunoglobulin light chain junction region [Macaca mulatta]MOV63524.1 immunoglobulin light chain junction region [Macaca mulatta]MOV63874.1 immunoglobulin light chain junction region [Macaca mulatta]
CQQESDWSLAF